MILQSASLLVFSPTGTSMQVGESILKGVGYSNSKSYDFTSPEHSHLLSFSEDDLVVFVAPVYGGHIAPLALKRFSELKGSNTPAVIVAVYGNRAYEGALCEFDQQLTNQGFKIIAGATFVGEHSFSTSDYPISAARPNAEDLDFAFNFGERIAKKVVKAADLSTLYPVDVKQIARPKQSIFSLFKFIRKKNKMVKEGIKAPATPHAEDSDACIHCGACAEACPTGALVADDEFTIDPEKCIKCCACVKVCPQDIWVYHTPYSEMLSSCFKKEKKPQFII